MASQPLFCNGHGTTNGDVEIRLTRNAEDVIIVQSVVLGLYSPFFEASLSKRWTTSQSIPLPDGPIKHHYHLLFDDTNGRRDVDLVMLSRAEPAALEARPVKEISADTAAIMLAKSPWVPTDNQLTKHRMDLVNAHRQFLGLIHHKPLDIGTKDFGTIVNDLRSIVRVADSYGSLSVISIPVEHALHSLQPNLVTEWSSHCIALMYIATKIRLPWLLREVLCRLVGDPSWTESDFHIYFGNSESLEIILQKRQELQDMMNRMDTTILKLHLPKRRGKVQDRRSITAATAAFRNDYTKHFRLYHDCAWERCARKYRTLKDVVLADPIHGPRYGRHPLRFSSFEVEWSAKGRYHQNESGINDAEFNIAFRSLQKRAAKVIEPLFKNVVQAPVVKNKKAFFHQGFFCTNITEEELPWKDQE